mmetsp:Transcript_34958/g.99110  ORF Transcript_34958/g.99110 Transcript_34958/m.99110 type:complete len:350 (+) Transcript_34958:1012-2061(+)
MRSGEVGADVGHGLAEVQKASAVVLALHLHSVKRFLVQSLLQAHLLPEASHGRQDLLTLGVYLLRPRHLLLKFPAVLLGRHRVQVLCVRHLGSPLLLPLSERLLPGPGVLLKLLLIPLDSVLLLHLALPGLMLPQLLFKLGPPGHQLPMLLAPLPLLAPVGLLLCSLGCFLLQLSIEVLLLPESSLPPLLLKDRATEENLLAIRLLERGLCLPGLSCPLLVPLDLLRACIDLLHLLLGLAALLLLHLVPLEQGDLPLGLHLSPADGKRLCPAPPLLFDRLLLHPLHVVPDLHLPHLRRRPFRRDFEMLHPAELSPPLLLCRLEQLVQAPDIVSTRLCKVLAVVYGHLPY